MTAELEGLEECMAGLQDALDQVRSSSGNAAMQGGLAYVADVKALARSRAGDDRDGIYCKPSGDNAVIVGSPDPFSRRLEYGFYDMTDSLGRHYFQEPRPISGLLSIRRWTDTSLSWPARLQKKPSGMSDAGYRARCHRPAPRQCCRCCECRNQHLPGQPAAVPSLSFSRSRPRHKTPGRQGTTPHTMQPPGSNAPSLRNRTVSRKPSARQLLTACTARRTPS